MLSRQSYPLLFLIYIAISTLLFWNHPIREYSDTYLYYGLSILPVTNPDFWAGNRQFVPLLLFKAFNNTPLAIAYMQFFIYILSWTFLAAMTRRLWQRSILKMAGFVLILLYSLTAEVFLWNNVLYTESLSTSFFALVVGVGIWGLFRLRREAAPPWGLQLRVGFTFLAVAFVWAFTRDVNAYAILITTLLIGALILAKSALRQQYVPLASVLFLGSLIIFWGQDYTANQGGRWHYPLVNVITHRILNDPAKTDFFIEHGMPYNEQVQAMTQQDPVVDWSPIADWLTEHGKQTYTRFILSNPPARIFELIQHWGEVFNNDMYHWSGNGYPPTWQGILSFILYPKGFWLLGLSISGILMSVIRARQINFYGLIPLLLLLLIFPIAFLNWHGDTLDMDRHVLGVTTLAHLGIWLLWLVLMDVKPTNTLNHRWTLAALCPLILGFGLEASLQNDLIMNQVIAPLVLEQFPKTNVLTSWNVPDARYTLYQTIPAGSYVMNPRLIRPSTSSGSIDIYLLDSPLDEVSAQLAYRDELETIENWKRTALPGYMNAFAVDYLFFDNCWWDTLTDFQRSTLQDAEFYQPISTWHDDQTDRTYSVYQIISTQNYWDDQSQSAVDMRGLSDELYRLFQAHQTEYDLVPPDSIIFSPENQLEDKLTSLTKLGRLITSIPLTPDQQTNSFDLMLTLERVQYAEDLRLADDQLAALTKWRSSKQPQALLDAGISYLFFSSRWWQFLSNEEVAMLNDSQNYQLLQEWKIDQTGEFYRLYHINCPPPCPLELQ
jgi:hypothetical protein